MDDPPPPVPAIPESVNQAAARARASSKPKSLAFVSTPVRTASQKIAAAQKDKEARGSWFGSATVGDVRNVRTSDAVMATSKPRTQVELPPLQPVRTSQDTMERPESRGSSVNFSYPARLRVASPSTPTGDVVEEKRISAPTAQPQAQPKKRSSTISPQRGGSVRSSRTSSIVSDQTLVYDPNSRRMVPRSEITAVDQQVQAASEKKPKKKKMIPNRAGSHLSKGTMSRTSGTAVDSRVPNEAQMAAAASLRSRRNEAKQEIPQELEDDDVYEPPAAETVSAQAQYVSEPQTRSPKISSSPASNAPEVLGSPLRETHDSGLQRNPSVVREEDDESESDVEYEPSTSAALDAVPVRHSVYAHGVPSPPQSENTDDQPNENTHSRPIELAAPPIAPEPTMRQAVAERRKTEAIRRASRTHSNSPGRSAHFASVEETLIVKHEPPARSLSPRKSALKQSSPSRGMSPTGDLSDASGATPKQEPPPQRKKAVRVSFDDENTVVVGEAAGEGGTESPVPPSPQQATGRRPWYNTLGLGRKKDAVPLEEDEVMQPRPALPSFGSVRGRKQSPKPAEERPLVRPQEPAHEVSGQSSDHALGAVIHDQSVKNGANISKVREPLPPVVTSVEGGGYLSDTASSDDDAALLADTPKLKAEGSMVSQASTLVPEASRAANGSVAADELDTVDAVDFDASKEDAIPAISITQPSPKPEQNQEEPSASVYFPGSFPDTETETDNETPPARQATFEPVVQTADAQSTMHTPATVLATQPAVHEPTDTSDGDSIYSDAYEDLSEIDGDGFQSLNAVLGAPAVSTPPVNILQKAQNHREAVVTPTPQSYDEDDVPTPKAHDVPGDPWTAAKAYWRSLTAEKRAQLEKEAAEEAGVEADLEETHPEVKKRPRRKKSIEQRHAEKKAIEEHRATSDPSRSYMIKPGTKVKHDDYTAPVASAKRNAANQQQPAAVKSDSGMRLRKTMRGAPAQPVEADTHMRKTLRSAAPERLTSQVPMGVTTSVSSGGRERAASESTNQSLASVLPSSLRRRGSDSSASSFKRARTASTGFGFRKTMRTGTGSLDLGEQGREQASSRFSLRSMSPPVSMASRSLRSTLRGDSANTNNRGFSSSTRRHSEDSGKGYLRFSGSFARPAEKKGKQRVSRFGDDSSDDDEAPTASKRGFRSRFEDSSDEEEAPRPSQGILKTMRGKGVPSPPLPEEEELSDVEEVAAGDEKTPGVTFDASAGTSLRRSRSGRGMDGGRRSGGGGGGFMSSVLRRNKKNDGGGKISRPEITESAARRDTNLERSTEELTALRSNSLRRNRSGGGAQGSHTGSASSPPAGDGANWPLGADASDSKQVTETIGKDEGATPMRSPSVLAHSRSQPTMRPTSMVRRTLSSMSGHAHAGEEEHVVDEDGIVVPARRRKKFSALRRMFRLDE